MMVEALLSLIFYTLLGGVIFTAGMGARGIWRSQQAYEDRGPGPAMFAWERNAGRWIAAAMVFAFLLFAFLFVGAPVILRLWFFMA